MQKIVNVPDTLSSSTSNFFLQFPWRAAPHFAWLLGPNFLVGYEIQILRMKSKKSLKAILKNRDKIFQGHH